MNTQGNAPAKACGGQRFGQCLVNQQPVYDRKLKVKRPRKKGRPGPKFL